MTGKVTLQDEQKRLHDEQDRQQDEQDRVEDEQDRQEDEQESLQDVQIYFLRKIHCVPCKRQGEVIRSGGGGGTGNQGVQIKIFRNKKVGDPYPCKYQRDVFVHT